MRQTTIQHRATKRDLILVFFQVQLGRKFRTDFLHAKFGTAFRSRVSDLNLDPDCPITIHNEAAKRSDGGEGSWYWATERLPLFAEVGRG